MSTDTTSKKMKISKTIGTHSGSFHCDEALACFMLTNYTSEYKDASIVRTRDKKVMETLDLLVDVGGVYDPATGRFDHHQRGFEETFDEKHSIKLSSAGLIYKHFGQEIIRNMTQCNDEELEILYQKVYTDFVEAVDGIDNGVSRYPEDIKPLYKVSTGLSGRVGMLNPAWNESGDDIDERFKQAMKLAGGEFEQAVLRPYRISFPARKIVQEALAARFDAHPSGEIMVLTKSTIWKSHLSDLETELKVDPLVKYVLFEDNLGKWRVQCVAESPGSFASRKALPEAWRGVRDEELSTLSGIPGCIFVHASGFIGGTATFEGAMAMATKALAL